MSQSDERSAVDDFWAQRRQGDFVRTPCTLVVQTAGIGAAAGVRYVEVEGVVIVTQTCDLVSAAATDPHVQVAKLHTVDDERQKRWLQSGHVPQVVPIQGMDGYFADLSVVATLEKASLVGLNFDRSIESSQQADDFAHSVGRNFSRFAFPDSFQAATKKLRDRIRNKYNNPGSAEGRVLTKVRQIRAMATPNWESATFAATLTFIVDPAEFPIGIDRADPVDPDSAAWIDGLRITQLCEAIEDPGRSSLRPLLWQALVEAWAELCTAADGLSSIDAEVWAADEYTAADMWTSQRLDMDYLSDDEDPHSPER